MSDFKSEITLKKIVEGVTDIKELFPETVSGYTYYNKIELSIAAATNKDIVFENSTKLFIFAENAVTIKHDNADSIVLAKGKKLILDNTDGLTTINIENESTDTPVLVKLFLVN